MTVEGANPELTPVVDFLRHCLPFLELDNDELNDIARRIKIVYFPADTLLRPDGGDRDLTIVRKGAIDLRGAEGTLLDRLGEYDSVNLNGLAEQQPVLNALVIEDALLYILPQTPLTELRQKYRRIDRFFRRQRNSRLRRAARPADAQSRLLSPLETLGEKRVISCKPESTVVEAARLMTDKRVSCLLIMESNSLVGIVTDRDLRSRLVAERRDYQTPVSEIMSAPPLTLESGATVFDAMLMMSEQGIHHIPIMAGDMPAGVVTPADLVRSRQRDPVFLMQKISRETEIENLPAIGEELPGLVVGMVDEGARAEQIGQFLSVIGDAFTRRLLQLAERRLGDPPVPYVWLAFGSQGRREMALGADQDNTLLIDDRCQPEDRDYFAALAQIVCDGLNACGYPYCKGNIMATNPEWRQTLSEWREIVSRWVRAPTDDAVMRVSIFFDLREVAGESALADALQAHMLASAADNTIFLAALARNALSNSAPLGFFRRFVLEHNGEHRHTLDIKRRGILPLVDLVRVHALANRVAAVNTRERLHALAERKALALRDSRNLQDAFSFISQVRLRRQCGQLASGGKVSNQINPHDLQDMEKRQLRDAFALINDMQQSLSRNFTGGLY